MSVDRILEIFEVILLQPCYPLSLSTSSDSFLTRERPCLWLPSDPTKSRTSIAPPAAIGPTGEQTFVCLFQSETDWPITRRLPADPLLRPNSRARSCYPPRQGCYKSSEFFLNCALSGPSPRTNLPSVTLLGGNSPPTTWLLDYSNCRTPQTL